MPAIENLTAKIIKDAADAADETLRAARERAAETERRAKEKSARESGKILKAAQEEAKRGAELYGAAQKAGYRNALLKEKQNVISRAFDEALKRLNAMTGAAYRDFLFRNLLKTGGGGEILLPAGCGVTIDEINAFLRENGKESVTLSRESIDGGFALVRNGVSDSFEFSALADYLRDALEAEVTAVLF